MESKIQSVFFVTIIMIIVMILALFILEYTNKPLNDNCIVMENYNNPIWITDKCKNITYLCDTETTQCKELS